MAAKPRVLVLGGGFGGLEATFQNGESLPLDLVVSFPPYVARERYGALLGDDRGFIRVEPDSRRVMGHPEIFAVGDAADFPIKQAFLAFLQADAAAEHLAAEIEGRRPEVDFEPMSLCVMEELNKATFAQVPLKYTDDPLRPVTVATEDVDHYKVGVSPSGGWGRRRSACTSRGASGAAGPSTPGSRGRRWTSG
jgi:hypothetical protein